MTFSAREIPPLATRLAEARPVLAKEQLVALTKRIIDMTSADTASVRVRHTVRVISRMANDQVLSGDDGDELTIALSSTFGERLGASIKINQVDETTLRAIVERCEAIARENIGPVDRILPIRPQVQDTFEPVALWHDETVRAMTTTRGTVIPEVLGAVARVKLRAAGFLGLMARSDAYVSKSGIHAFSEETDSEVTVTARAPDGMSSGWGGQSARNWSTVRVADVAARAIEFAQRGEKPVAIEPGRRTAILGSAAVAQVMRLFAEQFDAGATDDGLTGFSRSPRGNKLRQRVFDPRISMRSDPADPDGGFRPFNEYFGHANPAMSWVENGVLKNLQYGVGYAMARGKVYSDPPYSIRVSGGTTTIDEMITQCKEGIYVNRFSGVDVLDRRTALMSGLTRDGCFLIKNGKIDRPVKNFRFYDSPFFFLNSIEALGVTERATFGYTPPSLNEVELDWPRPPIIVPPMMVRDFNFSSQVDAI